MNVFVMSLVPGCDVPPNRKQLFTTFKDEQHMIVGFNLSVTLSSFCMGFKQESDTHKLIETKELCTCTLKHFNTEICYAFA